MWSLLVDGAPAACPLPHKLSNYQRLIFSYFFYLSRMFNEACEDVYTKDLDLLQCGQRYTSSFIYTHVNVYETRGLLGVAEF